MKLNIKSKDEKKELRKFMKKRKHLVWYVKNPEDLNVESIVEHTLNYGDWDDVQKLIKIIGIKKMAEIFRKQTNNWRSNYRPYDIYYFTLFFNKHDPVSVEPLRKGFIKLQKTKHLYCKLTGI